MGLRIIERPYDSSKDGDLEIIKSIEAWGNKRRTAKKTLLRRLDGLNVEGATHLFIEYGTPPRHETVSAKGEFYRPKPQPGRRA
jgi:hypothetical protein